MKKTRERWHFCDNKKDADELFNLVKQGIKTATCFLYMEDEHKNIKCNHSIVTNWDEDEECLIKQQV